MLRVKSDVWHRLVGGVWEHRIILYIAVVVTVILIVEIFHIRLVVLE